MFWRILSWTDLACESLSRSVCSSARRLLRAASSASSVINLSQAAVQGYDLRLDIFAVIGRSLPVCLPYFEAEDAGKDAFPISGTLLGELVSFTLKEKGCVYKGFIIQIEGLFNTVLGGAQRSFGERFPMVDFFLVHIGLV